MSALVALTILAPLLCAALALAVRTHTHARDAITVAGLLTAAVSAIAMLLEVADSGTHRVEVGGWRGELGGSCDGGAGPDPDRRG